MTDDRPHITLPDSLLYVIDTVMPSRQFPFLSLVYYVAFF